MLKRLLVVTAALAVLVAPSAVQAQSQKDIVDTAVAAGSFKTLAAALQAAGLVDTLKGKGPFTVFAPDGRGVREDPEGRPRRPDRRQGEARQGPHLPRGGRARSWPLTS